nr:DUF1565 domain-containing protein [Desulfuromonas versatilis]
MGNTRLSVSAANGLLANDPPGSVIAAADSTSAFGGSLAVNTATGAFVYDPPTGAQNLADSFRYTVAGSLPTQVTINLAERIWFVRNNHPGADQGSDQNPFLSLAQAQAASDAGDTIFVFAGNGTAAGQDQGIALQEDQKLLGEGVGLKINGVPIVDPFPNALISNAALGLPGNTPVILLATGNEVAGFSIQATFNEGILALGGGGFHLHDNSITFAPLTGREGIRLLNLTGSNRVAGNTITGSPRDGVKLANNEDQAGDPAPATPVAATLSLSRNTIGNPGQDGINIDLEGAGAALAVNILTNTLTDAGAGADGNEGINITSRGAALVTAVLSGNVISGSAGEAVDLEAQGSSAFKGFVANNDLSTSAAASDLRAAIAGGATATACLELIDNANAAANSSFVVNNGAAEGSFQLFETGNDAPATRLGAALSDVPQGACAIALDGAALFQANCGVCHVGNGLGQGNVGPDITNRSAPQIAFQLANNPTMQHIRLSAAEIQAIAEALTSSP